MATTTAKGITQSKFIKTKPNKVIGILAKKEEDWTVTTSKGKFLGKASIFNENINNMGDRRYYFTCQGVNGILYSGIGYGGKGKICRLIAYAIQPTKIYWETIN